MGEAKHFDTLPDVFEEALLLKRVDVFEVMEFQEEDKYRRHARANLVRLEMMKTEHWRCSVEYRRDIGGEV